jgi:TolB protein
MSFPNLRGAPPVSRVPFLTRAAHPATAAPLALVPRGATRGLRHHAHLLSASLLIGSACFAAPPADSQTPAPEREAEFVNLNPSWSPDGETIVFESWRSRRGVLYIVNADGTGERQLTVGAGDNTHPHWSPDGSRIVYDSHRDGVWNLYTIRPDGTDERPLTRRGWDTASTFARHPAWSPDGKWIAFDSSRDGNNEIYVMSADGGEARRITQSPANESHPGWTPDSRVTFGMTTGDQRQTFAADPVTGLAKPLFEASTPWRTGDLSPDGRYLLFTSRDDGTLRLYVVPADGTSPPVALTPEGSTTYEWAWAPDSRRIAFYFDRDGRFDLYTVAVDGGDLRQLTTRSR